MGHINVFGVKAGDKGEKKMTEEVFRNILTLKTPSGATLVEREILKLQEKSNMRGKRNRTKMKRGEKEGNKEGKEGRSIKGASLRSL